MAGTILYIDDEPELLSASPGPIGGLIGDYERLGGRPIAAPVPRGDTRLPKETHGGGGLTFDPNPSETLLSDHGPNGSVVRPIVDQRLASFLEGRPSANGDAGLASDLDRFRMQHLCTRSRHLEHLFIAELGQMLRVRNRARIRGVDAVDIGVDLRVRGIESGGHGQRRRIAPAATERGDLPLVTHALIAGDDDHAPALELVFDPMRAHVDDARVEMTIVGDDAALGSREGDRVDAPLLNRHREQRHRDAFASREQHVELAPGRGRVDLVSEGEELIGRLAHRRDDDHHVVPRLAGRDDLLRDAVDLLHVGHGAATVFLDDDGHV